MTTIARSNQVARKYGRTPGERAFDRCFLPFAAFFVLSLVFEVIAWRLRPTSKPPTEAQLAAELPPPGWHLWLPFAFGLFLAVLWVRALITLVSVWRDPSSAVLRFSASVLLVPFAVVTSRLLLTPFQ